jgi:cytochrome c-type biogenesis protein CcmE
MTVQTTSALPGGSAGGPPRAKGRNRVLLIALSVAIVVGGIGAPDCLTPRASSTTSTSTRSPKRAASWQNKRLQLHGYVVPGSIKKRMNHDVQKLEYKFQIENCGAVAEAYFAGVVPDTFKDGAEVVLKGQLHGQQFTANEVMAKCPSKYQQSGGTHPVAVARCSRESSAGKAN